MNESENRQSWPDFGEFQSQPDPDPTDPDLDPDGHDPQPANVLPAVAGLTAFPDGPGRQTRLKDRLQNLYNEVDIVKMNAMRRIAEELNREPGEEERDVQKESQMVLKSVEIQARLLSEQRRNDPGDGLEPALEDIWRALINLPEAGAILRRESVRERIVQTLRKSLGEGR